MEVRFAAQNDCLLGHRNGLLAPYEVSEEYERHTNAQTGLPTHVTSLGKAKLLRRVHLFSFFYVLFGSVDPPMAIRKQRVLQIVKRYTQKGLELGGTLRLYFVIVIEGNMQSNGKTAVLKTQAVNAEGLLAIMGAFVLSLF